MEYKIKIDGIEYKLSYSAYSAYIYKNEFNKSIELDKLELIKAINYFKRIAKNRHLTVEDLTEVFINLSDEVIVYQLVWTFIKTYDSNTMDYVEWLKGVKENYVNIFLQEDFINLLYNT